MATGSLFSSIAMNWWHTLLPTCLTLKVMGWCAAVAGDGGVALKLMDWCAVVTVAVGVLGLLFELDMAANVAYRRVSQGRCIV